MNKDELFELWEDRQASLAELLASLGHGPRGEYRVDLSKNLFLWTDGTGTPVAAADTKFLLSYAFSDRSILMGWANASLPASAVVPAQETVPSRVASASEEDAWVAAMTVALGAGADFIYRAPSPQNLSFLGLWNVRPAEATDQFTGAHPRRFVVTLLQALVEELADGKRPAEVTKRLFVNQGRTLLHRVQYVDREHSCRALEEETGQTLVRIGEAMSEERRAPKRHREEWLGQLGELIARWEATEKKKAAPKKGKKPVAKKKRPARKKTAAKKSKGR